MLLARHPRYHVQFTPTSGTWLKLVERFVCGSNRTMRPPGSRAAVRTLERAMLDYLDQRNKDLKPANAALLLGKVGAAFSTNL